MANLILSAIYKNRDKENMFENLNQFLRGSQSQDFVEVPISVDASTWELVIQDKEVYVELYTHDINDVSHLDIELSKFMDEIFSEIQIITEF